VPTFSNVLAIQRRPEFRRPNEFRHSDEGNCHTLLSALGLLWLARIQEGHHCTDENIVPEYYYLHGRVAAYYNFVGNFRRVCFAGIGQTRACSTFIIESQNRQGGHNFISFLNL
jgi:hypothetical protein